MTDRFRLGMIPAMAPGPKKAFDPAVALEAARDLFWERGYDGTGISDLESALGIGRKSLYDTFGSKRELYLASLGHYSDGVIGRICGRLESDEGTAMENLERVLHRLQKHHASADSLGCLLGVAMAQAKGDQDADAAKVVNGALRRLEQALSKNVKRAQAAGDLRADLAPLDVARQLVALTQGMALLGRVTDSRAPSASVVRSTLASLRP